MAHGRFFFVRHGESGWNADGIVQGQSPNAPGLTERGQTHAAVLAARLMRSGADLILTSDLPRAVETARPIAAALALPLQVEPRLRERALGTAEGRVNDAVGAEELGFSGGLVTAPDARPLGGESIRDLYLRIEGLLDALVNTYPERRVILVSHGGPLRIVHARLTDIAVEHMAWPTVTNGSVLEVEIHTSENHGRHFYGFAQEITT